MLGARGPWRKMREIGKGAFGLVYLVQRGNDERKFVMKEVNLRGLPREAMMEAQNEVAVLKKLKHPHAIAIEEALVVEETLCIVMEWAEGKDLGALIAQRKQENRPFSEEEILKIFWQLTSALAYCHHDLHMLHRDLKPQNVFLAGNGDVKLGDFGLAKIIEATCALVKTQCGTPVYMSPELCLGQDYNRGADVWALGCILYELMTLTMPWSDIPYNAAGGMSALLKKIANSSLDLTLCKRRYSLELCNLLASLIHKQTRCRPALNQVMQLEIVKKAAPRPPQPTPRAAQANGERPLPPSWRKVPSASRPGAFSYVHVPTGFKQAAFPERDELSDEVLAALKKQTFTPGKPPPTAGAKPPQTQGWTAVEHGGRGQQQQQHTPSGQNGRPSPSPMGTPKQQQQQQQPGARGATPPSRVNPTGVQPRGATPPSRAATPSGMELPGLPSWRKVPSSSRPGAFSYLHVPTGFKQAEMPTSDAPPPATLAAWQKQNMQTAGRPPATGVPTTPAALAQHFNGAPPGGGGPGGRPGKLQHAALGQVPNGMANGQVPNSRGMPHKPSQAFQFQGQQQQQRRGPVNIS